jgi:ethanolamine utilization cobalamin adenosyltransferase
MVVPVVTEADLREQVRRPVQGARVAIPAGAVLSPSARDFAAAWQLELVPQAAGAAKATATWDHPGDFPVRLDGEVPACAVCGSAVSVKPGHLTQVDAGHFGPKNSPRMRLRGCLDEIHALALLAANRALADGHEVLAGHLESVAAYCRELLSAEYQGRAAGALVVDGLDEAAVHAATHDPQGILGVPHVVPAAADPEVLHWLNLLRCRVRAAELAALDAFPADLELPPARRTITHGLNRLSSAVYYLELELRVEEGQP